METVTKSDGRLRRCLDELALRVGALVVVIENNNAIARSPLARAAHIAHVGDEFDDPEATVFVEGQSDGRFDKRFVSDQLDAEAGGDGEGGGRGVCRADEHLTRQDE